MKKIIESDKTYIKSIGRFLYSEKFDDGSEFYILKDKYEGSNFVDTGRTIEEITERIRFWEDLVDKNVVRPL